LRPRIFRYFCHRVALQDLRIPIDLIALKSQHDQNSGQGRKK
jgi:hypothetical protein